MFEFVRGKLLSSCHQYAILDVGGVGYKLLIPPHASDHFPSLGEELLLYTSFVVREQSHTLYGFSYPQQRDLFELFLSLSGIGPKIALSLLGHLSFEDFRAAIRQDDAKVLCKVPGIGRKSAERILVELRDKLPQLHQGLTSIEKKRATLPSIGCDALSALVNLGYSQQAAEKAIQRVLDETDEELDLTKLITSALHHA